MVSTTSRLGVGDSPASDLSPELLQNILNRCSDTDLRCAALVSRWWQACSHPIILSRAIQRAGREINAGKQRYPYAHRLLDARLDCALHGHRFDSRFAQRLTDRFRYEVTVRTLSESTEMALRDARSGEIRPNTALEDTALVVAACAFFTSISSCGLLIASRMVSTMTGTDTLAQFEGKLTWALVGSSCLVVLSIGTAFILGEKLSGPSRIRS